MYLQYRLVDGIYKLIRDNNRPDEDNEAILRGDYLDKTPTYTEDGEEIPFVMPSRDELLKQFIFPQWQQGDILVIADSPLKYPKLQGDTLVEMTREEVCETGDLSVLDIGEVYQERAIIKKEKPNGVKIEWIYPNWIETASDDEITEYIGKNITKLLYEVLSIGCEVTINGEKHQQSLSDEKRKALNERISGFKLAEELGSPITHVAWPFKNDGTDTVVMTTDKFKQLALTCLDFGDKCYIAAELLKAKRNINTTLEDFYSELEYIDEINLENL